MPNEPENLENLFDSAPHADRRFDPTEIAHLPEPAQRYLAHAIAPEAPLAAAVRLRMHGTIRLKKRWHPFTAEQVIVRDRGMVWRARVKFAGTTIRGFDCFLDGEGRMRWKLAGVLPVMRAEGPDITRSSAGRFAAESVWLPSVFVSERVSWEAEEPGIAHARFAIDEHDEDVALTLSGGCLQSVALSRWGNPDGGDFRDVEFGAAVDQEATFDGYTIPARIRAGWYFGTDRFESEGKFLHATIDSAVFR
jgi:hypothetical protein